MTEAQSCTCCSDELKALFNEWIEKKDDADATKLLAPQSSLIVRLVIATPVKILSSSKAT